MINVIPSDIGEALEINPESHTGLSWKSNGKDAGSFEGKYYRVTFKYKQYKVHRVVYFLATGKQPKLLDHIDRNKLNNSVTNLREATASENQWNRDSKNIYKSKYGWYCQFKKFGKTYTSKVFKTLEEAKAEREIMKAKREAE